MNYLQGQYNFESIEEGMKKLKEAVSIRDQMGGAMYFNMLNEDCCAIANKLSSMGADRQEISNLLGKENHQ